MITTRPHGRPNGALLARVQRRLTPRWQTVAQIAGDDMVGDVARALSTLERDGLAEREGQRWRAPQPPKQAPASERVVEPVAELVPVVVPPLFDAAPPPPVDLPAAVQNAARRRDWWTRTELATSVEIRTGAGRGAIEVEIARQLDDGRLQTEARGIRIRVPPPELPPEPELAPAEAAHPEPSPGRLTYQQMWDERVRQGGETRARLLEAVTTQPGATTAELAKAIGRAGARVTQLGPELGMVSVPDDRAGSGRRSWRWYPPGWSLDTDTDSTPPSPEPGSQTLVPQAPASGGVQVDDDEAVWALATPTRPLIDGQLRGEPGDLAEEDALLAQAAHVERCDGCGGRRDDFYVVPMADGGHALLCGCGIVIAARPEAVRQAPEPDPVVEAPTVGDRGWWFGLGPGELAETAERLQEELDALRRPHVEPCPDAITLRAILAVLDLLDRPGVDPVARVALLVGECRAHRARA